MKKVIRLLGKIGQADPMIWGYVMLHWLFPFLIKNS